MTSFIYRIDQRINLPMILLFFWSMFWTLNGLDKFCNGRSQVDYDLTHGYLVDPNQVDADGNPSIVYQLRKSESVGWFGVNRDAKMINYFRGLYLPAWFALGSLYGIAALEVLLGILFFAIGCWALMPVSKRDADTHGISGCFSDRTFHRLAFKCSILIFFAFCIGDILFGDRTELWEHGTFIILSLITYDLWYRTDRFFSQAESDRGGPGRSAQAATYDQ